MCMNGIVITMTDLNSKKNKKCSILNLNLINKKNICQGI